MTGERPGTQATDDEVMCHCSGTRRGQLRALHAQGKDLAAISRWTGALSGCGGCEWDIADFLKQLPPPDRSREADTGEA